MTRGFRDWRNWSGSVACRAAFFAALTTEAEVVEVVRAADPAAGLATVWAGSTIQQLGPRLRAQGLALINMGDIDRQGIAGGGSRRPLPERLSVRGAGGVTVRVRPR